MGMIEAIIFGFFALTASTAASMSIGKNKKNLVGIVLSLLSIILLVLSAYNWRLALIDSGKDPAFLGLQRYPFVPVIYCSAILINLVCILIGLSKRGKGE